MESQPPVSSPLLASVMEDGRVISIRVTDTQSNQVFLSTQRGERRIGGVSFVQKPVVYRGEEIGRSPWSSIPNTGH
ncbi:hypothetical protein [Paludibacterium denitrificans]|uniref:hypothetical protein n=1 Tax=Paludibacterium denitrificans TaxID=2675226 RepID=UPI001E2950B3|nr:hypothetical protein [Paludibacterium denitrificans]